MTGRVYYHFVDDVLKTHILLIIQYSVGNYTKIVNMLTAFRTVTRNFMMSTNRSLAYYLVKWAIKFFDHVRLQVLLLNQNCTIINNKYCYIESSWVLCDIWSWTLCHCYSVLD